MATASESVFGTRRLRSEDPRFLLGKGRYLENIEVPGALRAAFVRSIMPHARLLTLHGLQDALAVPGVEAVFTAADLNLSALPPAGNVEGATGDELEGLFGREPMARDVVRFVGEPYAVVLAESAAKGEDAAELIHAEAEPLPAVLNPEQAVAADAPLLWPEHGSNVAHEFGHATDVDPLEGAEVVVRARLTQQRLAPVPLETNGIIVIPERNGRFTVWVSSQVPFDVRADLAELFGVSREMVRTIAPDVGGGFGAKLQTYPEYLIVARAAQLLGRPVRWTESRSESMIGLTHGRAQVHHVDLGARRDGSLVGMRAELLADMGAYPIGAYLPGTTGEMLSGVYRIPKISYRGRSVVTNTTPVAPYRGAGRPEATALVERAMDMLARELSLDPVELRRRNLIPAEAFPYKTATGLTYDSGDYSAALDRALALAGYEQLRAEQSARRSRGDRALLGIGVSIYVEITSFSSREFADVEVAEDGRVVVRTGISPHGQGHETSLAQLAAAALGVGFEKVRVIHSDTGEVARGSGTWGSRSLQAGGSSVWERSLEVAERARCLAAHVLEVDPADLVVSDGEFHVTGAPERSVSYAELARIASDPAQVPEDMEPELRSTGVYREPGSTFPFGAHVAVVEVDVETGSVRLVRHVAVDDCGRILNPMLVDGQVHGGLAQGIAQALYEEFRYDGDGNPMTGTMTQYLVPSAAELPSFELDHTQTPTDVNPLGAKGIGESATIGSAPAVHGAVVDALSHLGVGYIDMPASPESVWRAIQAAGRRGRVV